MNEKSDNSTNPFLIRLRDNQLEQARSALIKTISENADQTIGGVLDALESDDSGEGIMEDMFRRLTIAELVGMVGRGGAAAAKKKKAPAFVPADDELDDDDEYSDDGSDEEEVEAAPVEKKKKKKKKKKNAEKQADADVEETPAASTPAPTSKLVLKYISKHAPDADSAVSSAELREALGGDAPAMKEILDALIAGENICKIGQARGTKYHAFG